MDKASLTDKGGRSAAASSDASAQITFASGAAWERWLRANHSTSAGVWVKIAKQDSGIESVHYPDVLDIALCHGWIDGQRRAFDERYFLQRFTPRRARSRWSLINTAKVERLTAEGRMHPAGMVEVERAQADGRWAAAYVGQRVSEVPEDLQRELDRSPRASAFFAQLSSQNRYAITYRLHEAKRADTRARRLAGFVAMLEAGERIHA